jgi:thymidine kinase
MFSGKSTELQRRLRRYELAHKTCFRVQYAKDTRYVTKDPETGAARAALVTHDRRVVPADCAVTRLKDAAAAVPPGTHVIAVDEAQFFPDAAEVCQAWANAGITVLVAALDATFERLPFPVTAHLIAVAERVDKLVSVCAECGGDRALWSFRTTEATTLEVIGGADAYMPLCRQCWLRHPGH